MTKHEDLPYINHILDAINDIQESVKSISKEEFLDNKDIRDANIRRLEIIGEAVKNLSEDFKNKNKSVEWKKIAGTRDVLIHAYFDVDVDLLWAILEKDIPELKLKIRKAIIELSDK